MKKKFGDEGCACVGEWCENKNKKREKLREKEKLQCGFASQGSLSLYQMQKLEECLKQVGKNMMVSVQNSGAEPRSIKQNLECLDMERKKIGHTSDTAATQSHKPFLNELEGPDTGRHST